MILKVVGAGAGAYVGNMVATKFVLPMMSGDPNSFGADDVVLWLFVGLGAWGGMSLAAKI